MSGAAFGEVDGEALRVSDAYISRWYALNTLPAKEAVAAQNLDRQGFSFFLPTTRKTVRHARRMLTVRRPLFPGYIFVSLDLSRDRWRSVNGTFGARGLVSAADVPLPVPEGLVEALQRAGDQDGFVSLAPDFRAGDRVCFSDGPFADVHGVVERLAGPDRVRVLMDILNGRMAVDAFRRQLTLLS